MWRKPAPSQHKYTQNFKLNNCAISKIPETSHIFKPLLNAVLYFRNLINKVTFISKVRFRLSIVTQTLSVGKAWFHAMYFQHKVFRQSSVQISLITQNFSSTFLEII
jgi:hypothetical protein